MLMNLLKELAKRDKMRGLPNILTLFHNELNVVNNTRERMLDSIYHIALKSHFWRKKSFNFAIMSQRCYGGHNVSRKSVNH